jgi:hypothetical protein
MVSLSPMRRNTNKDNKECSNSPENSAGVKGAGRKSPLFRIGLRRNKGKGGKNKQSSSSSSPKNAIPPNDSSDAAAVDAVAGLQVPSMSEQEDQHKPVQYSPSPAGCSVLSLKKPSQSYDSHSYSDIDDMAALTVTATISKNGTSIQSHVASQSQSQTPAAPAQAAKNTHHAPSLAGCSILILTNKAGRRNSVGQAFKHTLKKGLRRMSSFDIADEDSDDGDEDETGERRSRTKDQPSKLTLLVQDEQWHMLQGYVGTEKGMHDLRTQLDFRPSHSSPNRGSNLLQMTLTLDPPMEFIRLIVEECPDLLNVMNKRQQTPLHVATAWGASPQVAQLLLHHAPEQVSALDDRACTPLHVLCEHGWPHLQDQALRAVDKRHRFDSFLSLLFQAYPQSTSQTNKDGYTPLQYLHSVEAGAWMVKTLTHQVMQAKQAMALAKTNELHHMMVQHQLSSFDLQEQQQQYEQQQYEQQKCDAIHLSSHHLQEMADQQQHHLPKYNEQHQKEAPGSLSTLSLEDTVSQQYQQHQKEAPEPLPRLSLEDMISQQYSM